MLDIPFVIAGAYLYNKSKVMSDSTYMREPLYNYFVGGLFWPYRLPLSVYRINKMNKEKLHKKYMKDDEYAEAYRERERIKAGSGEKMRRVGSKGAPTAKAFKQSARTAKRK